MALASIQTIKELSPIPGADRIEKARVLGWDCVVKKGIFKEGDECIYVEIDTLIPTCLLSDNPEERDLIRLKTVKMKGQLSQGLVLPLSHLKTFHANPDIADLIEVSELSDIVAMLKKVDNGDVTTFLGIKKYEREMPGWASLDTKGAFPNFIPRTDEVRIQSAPEILDALNGRPYYITVKLDGTSATFYKKDGVFGVCSRNREMKDTEGNCYFYVARKYGIEEWLPDNFAVQGEIVGFWNCSPDGSFSKAIQGNKLGLEETKLFLFNAYDIEEHQYVYPTRLPIPVEELSNILQFWVPEVEFGGSFSYTQEQLLELAKGNYESGQIREGIVVRSIDPGISFKVINNDFLLKNGE